MTTEIIDRATPQRAGDLVADPLAAGAVIPAGRMYILDGDGNAVIASSASARPVRAVTRRQAVQADGDTATDGSLGCFRFVNDATAPVTRADIGAIAYVVDGQTVAKSGSAIAGVIFDVEDAGVWVQISASAPTAPVVTP